MNNSNPWADTTMEDRNENSMRAATLAILTPFLVTISYPHQK